MDKEIDLFKLTAKDCKMIAETTTDVLKKILEFILERSKIGFTEINWDFNYACKACVDNTVAALREKGFKVHFYGEQEISVKWN